MYFDLIERKAEADQVVYICIATIWPRCSSPLMLTDWQILSREASCTCDYSRKVRCVWRIYSSTHFLAIARTSRWNCADHSITTQHWVNTEFFTLHMLTILHSTAIHKEVTQMQNFFHPLKVIVVVVALLSLSLFIELSIHTVGALHHQAVFGTVVSLSVAKRSRDSIIRSFTPDIDCCNCSMKNKVENSLISRIFSKFGKGSGIVARYKSL